MKIRNVFEVLFAGLALGFLGGCDQNDDKTNISDTQSQALTEGSVAITEKDQPHDGTNNAVIYRSVTDTNYISAEFMMPVIQNPEIVVINYELTNIIYVDSYCGLSHFFSLFFMSI